MVTTKTFSKGTRDVPTAGNKASKWYPVNDVRTPKKVSPPAP